MKKLYCSIFALVCLLIAMGVSVLAEEEGDEEKYNESEIIIDSNEGASIDADVISEEIQIEKDILNNEEDIQYYAHLNLDVVDPELVPIIIRARDMIIFRQSWVADGVQGYVYDRYGNMVEEVPQFSELFPEDWSVPIVPTGVDLSYYGK